MKKTQSIALVLFWGLFGGNLSASVPLPNHKGKASKELHREPKSLKQPISKEQQQDHSHGTLDNIHLVNIKLTEMFANVDLCLEVAFDSMDALTHRYQLALGVVSKQEKIVEELMDRENKQEELPRVERTKSKKNQQNALAGYMVKKR